MQEIQSFQNNHFGHIRVMEEEGELWFVASDVCAAIDVNTSQTRRIDDDEKGLRLMQTPGGVQEVTVINEPGLYSLVLSSRKPEAKQFKRWVTHEVIPSIRKHGAYMTDETIKKAMQTPDFIIQLAQALKEEQEQRRKAETQLQENAPLVTFAEAVQASKESILIGELAKVLKQNGIDIGRKRLFAWLRDNGYLMRHGEEKNLPTQYSMELNLFELKKGVYTDAYGVSHTRTTTKVTAKGQVYFINLFLKKLQSIQEN